MTQTAIPYLFMRGGSSRGPYFRRADLPQDRATLARVLRAVVGSGHSLCIDGLGGGAAVTTKVAMLSRSQDPWAQVDYFFAQAPVEGGEVDFGPTCGNILSGVGPAALAMGLVEADGDETEIRIRAVNTGARVVAQLRTPGGRVRYDGETAIAGVPGTGAPIALKFMDVAGSATGAFLPTGRPRDAVQGVALTCMDVAMPVVIARAADLGLTGRESAAELDADAALFTRIEALRVEAGALMGMGDVARSVTPKFAVVAPASSSKARAGGALAARYFMPWRTHPAMAVTGAQCLAACALTPGTVAEGLVSGPVASPARLVLEHPSGDIEVVVEFDMGDGFALRSAGLIRTARLLAEGRVFVPAEIWDGG